MKDHDDYLDIPLVVSEEDMEKLRKSEIRHSHSGLNRGLFRESIQEGVQHNYITRNSSMDIQINSAAARRKSEAKTLAQSRKTVLLEQNLAELEDEIGFDRRLKEQYMMKEDKDAHEAKNFQKNWLSKFKNVALFFYYIVIPFIQTPDWCTNGYSDYAKMHGIKDYKLRLLYDCALVAEGK